MAFPAEAVFPKAVAKMEAITSTSCSFSVSPKLIEMLLLK